MSITADLTGKVQNPPPQQLSLPPNRTGQLCLLTCRSAAARRVMRGPSPSSLCEGCSLSHPSHTHPNEAKARATRTRWRKKMGWIGAAQGGDTRPSLKMTSSGVKVMRYEEKRMHSSYCMFFSIRCAQTLKVTRALICT